ncbi:RES family NAD+ phosphorylase [Dyadobacter aurulentus]|uniref:RES family NAD+ phosphorylase n=1 Tax=Dyadobacter sp. UC 10 TaxID=2605428 RepID=UPI0011F213A3|nr:RES family NAD+ phosphorylase [Dyadobacter sp. UC 10]KAA0993160.1 RES family NAD+ phosphorylase [Dyadobacter sp. UC 10]
MELFRISRVAYQDDLTGIGAFRHGGRWNSPGHHMLYTASHRSLAMLEVLVHLNKSIPPPDYVIVVLYIPDAMATVNVPYMVPDWEFEQHWSRDTGDQWITKKTSLLCRVPSIVVQSEYNFLINPAHENAGAIKVVDKEPFEFDTRLFTSFVKK